MYWRNSRFGSRSSRVGRWALARGACLAVIAFLANTSSAADSLPWVKDFAAAREIASREGKPLFVMMTATWCGPCKQLEQKTLSQKVVQSALRDFVWVQAFEDRMIEKKYQCGGYPTLAFVDPSTDKVISRTTGYQPVGPFLRTVIEARRAGKLGIDPDLEAMAAKVFTPNPMKIQEFIAANDGKGLKEYLLPASQDVLRNSNFALLKISLPDDIRGDEVKVLSSSAQYPFTPSGLFCVQVGVAESAAKVQVIAPGCRVQRFTNVLTAAQRDAILAAPPPRIFFWLFDSSGRGNGLHLESKKFDEIEVVNDGNPIDPRSYFKFLRGEPLKVGQVYTVYCCAHQRYAKLEITHLSPPAGNAGP